MNFAVLLISGATMIGPVSADSLDDFIWRSRPIIIFAAEGDPRLTEQLRRFRNNASGLIERDNVIIVDTVRSTALRERFDPRQFTVVLVGKDGSEKFRRDGLVDPAEIEAMIDRMPMRRDEMRGRNGHVTRTP